MRTLAQLNDRGQSPWYDNLSRTLISSGELKSYLDSGIVGVTSNPTIFDNAISSSSDYDSALKDCAARGLSAEETYWELVCDDIAAAADVLKDVYERSNKRDGYVSVEVSPLLARNTAETIAQANELFARIQRDNVMIKIPATQEGIPAIEAVLANNIPVNVTLIFSQERYRDVIAAYKKGAATAIASGAPDAPQSVASFFISRLDAKVDAQLDEDSELAGKAAVANAGLAYELFESEFDESERASAQRPLWASTGTKNPAYSPVLYVDSLIAPHTVNTLPQVCIDAISSTDGDYPGEDMNVSVDAHRTQWSDITKIVSMDSIMKELEDEGVASFEKSYHSCLASIESRLADFT
jgi:transaldolase